MENKIIIDRNIEEINRKITQKLRRKRIINSSVRYTILTIVGFIMLYPLLWMIGSSFKENSEIFRTVSFIPESLNFNNYIDGWKTSTEYTFTTYRLSRSKRYRW